MHHNYLPHKHPHLSLTLLICLLCAWQAKAQKEDHVWLLGGTLNSVADSIWKACALDFNGDSMNVVFIDQQLPYERTNTSICDSSGQMLIYSNGESLFNADHEIISNGGNFYPNVVYTNGFPAIQSFLLLPFPGHPNQFVHIYGALKTYYTPYGGVVAQIRLYYAVADMSLESGKGQVIGRDYLVGSDSIEVGRFSAIRHGNGRDWWVLTYDVYHERVYRYLLSPTGLELVGSSNIQKNYVPLAQTCYSPDGKWYADFSWHGIVPDSSFSTIHLFNFDRCEGLLTNHIQKTYDYNGANGKPGGVAFSRNNRFMYVSRWDSIFQYDLQAPDILGSEMTVAVYDGFRADYNLPTRFYNLLLAPDDKIYGTVSNFNSRYMHVIESPNEPGLACNVQQHGLHLPVFNSWVIPNMPHYRLWDWEGSPCDTINTVAVQQPFLPLGWTLSPNPASDITKLTYHNSHAFSLRLLNLDGKVVYTSEVAGSGEGEVAIPVGHLPAGGYLLHVVTDKGSQVIKLVVQR